MTQEKNVKVARFPLIYLDETILAHTNLAEFNRFLQEKENEALLDRMVIIKVPYALSYRDEARIYQETGLRRAGLPQHSPGSARAASGGGVRHSDAPDASRSAKGLDLPKKVRIFAGEAVEGLLRDRGRAAARRSAG